MNCTAFAKHVFVKAAIRETERSFIAFYAQSDAAEVQDKAEENDHTKLSGKGAKLREIRRINQSSMNRLRSLAQIACINDPDKITGTVRLAGDHDEDEEPPAKRSRELVL